MQTNRRTISPYILNHDKKIFCTLNKWLTTSSTPNIAKEVLPQKMSLEDNGISSKSLHSKSESKEIKNQFPSWPKKNWSIKLEFTTSETTWEGFDQVRYETGILCQCIVKATIRDVIPPLCVRRRLRLKYRFQIACTVLIKCWSPNSRR